jgi:hypothetical protein
MIEQSLVCGNVTCFKLSCLEESMVVGVKTNIRLVLCWSRRDALAILPFLQSSN